MGRLVSRGPSRRPTAVAVGHAHRARRTSFSVGPRSPVPFTAPTKAAAAVPTAHGPGTLPAAVYRRRSHVAYASRRRFFRYFNRAVCTVIFFTQYCCVRASVFEVQCV
ncbi:hypothetical protein ACI65C_000628 [Semiaphis heraclei]